MQNKENDFDLMFLSDKETEKENDYEEKEDLQLLDLEEEQKK